LKVGKGKENRLGKAKAELRRRQGGGEVRDENEKPINWY
jgi:hypothetical protein